MFGALAVFYLFLGGAGAGAIAACSALDLLAAKRPHAATCSVAGPSVRPLARAVDAGFAVGFVCLIVGMISLVLDLGRVDRAFALFLDPHPTLLTLGSYALAALAVLAAFAAAVRFFYLPFVPRRAVVAAEAAAIVLAVVVMLYTGLLLGTVGGVPLWSSPLIPVLFLLSSCSSGLAILFFAAPFTGLDAPAARVFHRLMALDAVIIAVELACTAAFVLLHGASDRPGAPAALDTLLTGDATAAAWWFGFVVCGLVLPLALEVVALCSARCPAVAVAIVAALVLVGAFCLRYSIVEAADHRALALEPVEHTLNLAAMPAAQPAGSSFTIPFESVHI